MNMVITRRRKHSIVFSGIWRVLFEILRQAVSKHDLKPSGTFLRTNAFGLGFAAYEIFEKTSLNTSVNTAVKTPLLKAPIPT